MDLNKTCPKDHFPLPQIDQLVDATVGHPRMSFLDAFYGYYQIPLALDDQKKIAFLTPTGNYHYKVMPFGISFSATYYVQTRGGGGSICLHCCSLTHGESGVDTS